MNSISNSLIEPMKSILKNVKAIQGTDETKQKKTVSFSETSEVMTYEIQTNLKQRIRQRVNSTLDEIIYKFSSIRHEQNDDEIQGNSTPREILEQHSKSQLSSSLPPKHSFSSAFVKRRSHVPFVRTSKFRSISPECKLLSVVIDTLNDDVSLSDNQPTSNRFSCSFSARSNSIYPLNNSSFTSSH